MTTSKKKKKKESIFMKSFLKVWTGNDGKIHSKARGNIEQNINNYNAMISYLKEQANSMAGVSGYYSRRHPGCYHWDYDEQPESSERRN